MLGPHVRAWTADKGLIEQAGFVELAKLVEYEALFDTDGDGELGALERIMMKYDADKSGEFSVAEVKAIVNDLESEKKQACRAAPARPLSPPLRCAALLRNADPACPPAVRCSAAIDDLPVVPPAHPSCLRAGRCRPRTSCGSSSCKG